MAFAIFLLWFFSRNLDWADVNQSLRRANWSYLFAAGAIVSFGYLLRAVRWKVLLEPITETSLKELFATTTVGFSAVCLVGRAGELVRPMWLPLRDKRVRPSAALITLGLERICDLAALVSFFSVNLIWFKAPAGREGDFGYVRTLGIAMLGAVALGIFGLYVYQRYADPIIGWFERATDRKFIHRRIRSVFLSLLRQMATSLKILKDWREVALIVFWTIALWFAIAIPTWLVIAAFGLPLSFGDALFVMGWAAMGSIVPTPGGAAGAFHAATAGGLIFLGTDRDEAFAVSIIMHLVYFTPALIFGLYYFIHGDITIERIKSLLSSEHAVEEVEHETEQKTGDEPSNNKVEAIT